MSSPCPVATAADSSIARELYVTLNTLRIHTKRTFTKLDVTTRSAAVRRAHEHGQL